MEYTGPWVYTSKAGVDKISISLHFGNKQWYLTTPMDKFDSEFPHFISLFLEYHLRILVSRKLKGCANPKAHFPKRISYYLDKSKSWNLSSISTIILGFAEDLCPYIDYKSLQSEEAFALYEMIAWAYYESKVNSHA